METAVGSRKHTRKRRESGERMARQGPRCLGERRVAGLGLEKERGVQLCPTITTAMTAIIIMRVRCHQHLSLENALREQAELVNFLPALPGQHQQ